MSATPAGKAVTARNSTTHGLHAKDFVLPHLGESHAEFDTLCDGLARELRPRTAVEHHHVTQAAQAMWRLRRLARWEQGLYDDPALTDEERFAKMSRVLRHDAALRRHIDRALKALGDTPTNCQNEPEPCHPSSPFPRLGCWGKGEVARDEPEGVPQSRRDFPSRKISPALQSRDEKCQNEPCACAGTAPACTGTACCAPAPLRNGEVASLGEPEGSPHPPADPNNRDAGGPCDRGTREQGGGPPRAGALRKAQKLKQQKKCQNEPV